MRIHDKTMNHNKQNCERPPFPHEISGQTVSNKDNASLIERYAQVLSYLSDQEVVDRFNGLVGKRYTNIWIQALRTALMLEFDNRNIDVSAFVEKNDKGFVSISFRQKIQLESKGGQRQLVQVL